MTTKLQEKKICRYCACTDEHACSGGCYWVIEDGENSVCSGCVDNLGNDKEIESKVFDALKDQASKHHARTWCMKRQKAIPTISLSGEECCSCKDYLNNGGICDPL